MMKSLTALLFTFFFIIYSATAKSSVQSKPDNTTKTAQNKLVTVTVNTSVPGVAIASNFSGLSFETGSILPNYSGVKGYFFDSTNRQFLTLVRNLGVKNLRFGGGTVDDPNTAIPKLADIDTLFGFVKAAGVKIIFSFRLQNGDSALDASTAKYIWNNYKQYMDYFSIGNEPNYRYRDPAITDYASFYIKWRSFAKTLLDSVPEAKLGGPDAAGTDWGVSFAKDEKKFPIISTLFFHNYVGSSSEGKTPKELIELMLSTSWVTSKYPTEYKTVATNGFPFRFTEANSFTAGSYGVQGGNNSFASALYALDYLHWWAKHGCPGVHYHTRQWKCNGTFHRDASSNYQIYPMGYGIKAFNVGGHGKEDSVKITNTDTLNITAYAVSDTNAIYVTIINKEHGTGARGANISIKIGGLSDSAAVIYLQSPNGATDTTGMTLGGAEITNSIEWKGNWLPIDSINASSGTYTVTVPSSSAAIVRINNTVTSIREGNYIPKKFMLRQNYPNPFNPSTVINYQLSAAAFNSLKVYNILGQEVAILINEFQNAGTYNVNFDASGLASGVYIYKLQSGGLVQTKKMLLLK